MKAAQYFGQNDIRIVDVPTPEPQAHEVLIAVEWCGICGSDLHEYLHGPALCQLSSHPTNAVTLGHEFIGRVISAPPTSHLTPGTPVMVDPRIVCRTCTQCTAGLTHGCKTLGFKGLSGDGGFSPTVAVDARMCYPLPSDIDLSLAVLIEPLAVAWHAIVTTGLTDWGSKSVLIVGGGPVGVAIIFALRAFGCKCIVVSEPAAVRAEQLQGIADMVLNPVEDNIGEKCRKLTGGEGVDVAFDCAGNQKGFTAGIDALTYRGVYMNVALWLGAPMEIPFMPFIMKEITVKCCLAYNDEEFKDVVDAFVAGKFKGIETMITSKIHVNDIVDKGFKELITNKDQHVKILVTTDRSKV